MLKNLDGIYFKVFVLKFPIKLVSVCFLWIHLLDNLRSPQKKKKKTAESVFVSQIYD